MDLHINFAKPVGPYDMTWNKCVPTYCHVEMSIEIEKDLFSVIVDSNVSLAHDPTILETLLKRLKQSSVKTLHVCFYIMWGDVVSVRFLDDLNDDPLMRPPEQPIYDSIVIPLQVETLQTLVGYNLRQLGKPYDIPRAILLLVSFTLRSNDGETPSKFFCSQLVMHTLKECELYDVSKLNIDHMTPLNVYEWLKDTIKIKDDKGNGSENKNGNGSENGSAKSDK